MFNETTYRRPIVPYLPKVDCILGRYFPPGVVTHIGPYTILLRPSLQSLTELADYHARAHAFVSSAISTFLSTVSSSLRRRPRPRSVPASRRSSASSQGVDYSSSCLLGGASVCSSPTLF